MLLSPRDFLTSQLWDILTKINGIVIKQIILTKVNREYHQIIKFFQCFNFFRLKMNNNNNNINDGNNLNLIKNAPLNKDQSPFENLVRFRSIVNSDKDHKSDSSKSKNNPTFY